MKLTLLRHGETIENAKHIIQGQSPGVLSELGKQQVIDIAKKLKDTKFDVIISSDLKRCVDTAEVIHSYHPNVPLIYDKALREVSFGRFEGLPILFSKLGLRIGSALNLKAPGGENWHDLKKRVVPFLNQIYSKYPDSNVLVVTHGGPIRLIKSVLETNSTKQSYGLNVPNCEPWEFTLSGPVKLES